MASEVTGAPWMTTTRKVQQDRPLYMATSVRRAVGRTMVATALHCGVNVCVCVRARTHVHECVRMCSGTPEEMLVDAVKEV